MDNLADFYEFITDVDGYNDLIETLKRKDRQMTKLEELVANVDAAREACADALYWWEKSYNADAEADLNDAYAAYADVHKALKAEMKKAEGQTND